MSKYLVSIFNMACLLSLIVFPAGCGEKSGEPQKPKVVSRKIVMDKAGSEKEIPLKKEEIKKVEIPKTIEPKKLEPKKLEPKKLEPKKLETIAAVPEKKKIPSDQEKIITSQQLSAERKVQTEKLKKADAGAVKQDIQAEKDIGTFEDTPSDKTVDLLSQIAKEKMALEKIEIYNPEGKIDPFIPLLRDEPLVSAAVVKKKKRKRRIPLTPLEKIALSQVKLTAIINASSGNRAMVEDASGKGYIISKGTRIGTNSGKVINIFKNSVIVAEEVEDVFGKLIIQDKEIKLQKPPGE